MSARMARTLSRLVLTVALLAVAACGSLPHGAGAGSPSKPLGFTATTLDGAAFDTASLAGKPAVLWFWAPF